LNRLAAHTAPLYCKGCSHRCETCVDGPLRIADTLRYLMYYECYGQQESARAMYGALRPEERDFDAPGLRAAAAACPQGINLAARLERAREVLSA
jgi:predicted aldo/keto reductase-like oxidoreductase